MKRTLTALGVGSLLLGTLSLPGAASAEERTCRGTINAAT